jgi:hypothetical protein
MGLTQLDVTPGVGFIIKGLLLVIGTLKMEATFNLVYVKQYLRPERVF